jgi:hypothetical protein
VIILKPRLSRGFFLADFWPTQIHAHAQREHLAKRTATSPK